MGGGIGMASEHLSKRASEIIYLVDCVLSESCCDGPDDWSEVVVRASSNAVSLHRLPGSFYMIISLLHN